MATIALNYILIFDYKLILHKFKINNIRFVGLEMCAIVK
jgi:hypothetical protein